MTFALANVIAWAILAAFSVWIAAHDWRRRQPKTRFEQTLKKAIVVHTRSGHSVRGVLSGIYADGVTLVAAEFLRPDGEPPEPLAGEQILPWSSIDFTQELPVAGTSDS